MADISKRTVLILLVLVVISSLISMWAFVTSVNAPQKVVVATAKTSSAQGQVQLQIQPPKVASTSADIQLEIIEPKGG